MPTNTESSFTATRWRAVFVIILILLPLAIVVAFKYAPLFRTPPKISAVAVVPPRFAGPPEYAHLAGELSKVLNAELAGMPGVRLQRSPTQDEVEEAGRDLAVIAGKAGADALILTSVTVDAGMIQLGVQLVDPGAQRVLYNNPYQSSLERYPEMVRAATSALKRAMR